MKRKTFQKAQTLITLSAGVSIVCGILILITTSVLPLLKDYDDATFGSLNPIFISITFVFGLITYLLEIKATKLQHSMNDFIEKISNPVECARLLAIVLRFEDLKKIDEKHFYQLVKDRCESPDNLSLGYLIPEKISWTEQSRLLLLKGIEHGLLEQMSDEIMPPSFDKSYNLTSKFKPSVFNLRVREPGQSF